MGKGFNSFLDFFKIEDDDYDEYDEEQNYYEDEEVTSKRRSSNKPVIEEEEEEETKRSFLTPKPKVISMNQTSKVMEVSIIKPTSFEDSQEICNTLLRKRPVVVNLEGFDSDDAQRIMDFISGCIYAINGKFQPISKYIFIFSPENVDINGDALSFSGDGLGSIPTINREF